MFLSLSLPITNPTRSDLEYNTVLRTEEPNTYLLSCNTPLQFFLFKAINTDVMLLSTFYVIAYILCYYLHFKLLSTFYVINYILCYYLHFRRYYSAAPPTLIVNAFIPLINTLNVQT